MRLNIDLNECLRDSPKFRSILEQEEANVDQLEQKLDKIIKLCGNVVDSGKAYVAQQSLFANGLWDLSAHFKEDTLVLSSLSKLIHNLQEMNKFHTILLDQASRTILRNLTSFCKSDIKHVRDCKQHFEKISQDLDTVLVRNSQTARNKSPEIEEIGNLLVATRSCFGHQAMDYVYSIEILQNRKRHEVLSTLLSYMHACTTYYHQGSDLCEDLEPFLKKLAEEVATMQEETITIEKKLENRHSFVTNKEIIPNLAKSKGGPILEGYLFKRTSNAFKTWNRRWFCLRDNQLVYRKRSGDDNYTVMEEDLRLCTVKPVVDTERRFCFEVVSPLKCHMLQADSEEMLTAWILAVQRAVGVAFQNHPISSDTDTNKPLETAFNKIANEKKRKKGRIWEQLLRIPGNDKCCDCGESNPSWASINLGVTLCIECSGVHRSLGVHYSKVRSLTLDDWEPECIKVMAELGNTVVNKVYEANVPENYIRATPMCTNSIRENWIKSKYVERKFVYKLPDITERASRNLMNIRKWSVRRLRRRPRSCDNSRKNVVSKQQRDSVLMFGNDLDKPINETFDISSDQDSTGGEDNDTPDEEDISKLHPDRLLYKAALAHNLPVMCEALALGANQQWKNEDDHNRSAIHEAVLSGSVMSCAYLLLNGAKIDLQDDRGQTPLHLATQGGHTAQVCLLLKHRADQHLNDNEGLLPLMIAEQKKDADIVTLLRLGRLNEEMKGSDMGVCGDDTFNDVVRDFSQMACSHPERLQRTKNSE
ncbi:arf-GAP with coiled-coil, ANK repeat and PH domain-containing protein 2 [Onthophagus taurus]|uniref:arf-GAP with coiled-coil, ANK repeat and PH domain-containing protein 2 n=1 Tax=Onthophagus taurus TaxID=166361 RepID=UPI000C20B257|nr:arf-GAP with coiled-coil, ANK repeat and PH domain-containing protein 2 [Onthophagus taurus]